MVRRERIELEPICGRAQSGSPQGEIPNEVSDLGRRRRMSQGNLVRPERIELPTSWFVAKHSIQLSYGRMLAELRFWNYSVSDSFRPN